MTLVEHISPSTMRAALEGIWKIVHTPTKKTKYSSAQQHFQADFDAIRKIIRSALGLDVNSQLMCSFPGFLTSSSAKITVNGDASSS